MPEKLTLGSRQQPEQSLTPDMKFLNKLTELEAKKKELEKKIKSADENEKNFLLMSLEEVNKRIESYHQSFGKYRRQGKINSLKTDAGEETVAEVMNFKSTNRQPETEAAGIGKNFLKDLERFKKAKNPEV